MRRDERHGVESVFGQLLAAMQSGSPRERAAAVSITVSTISGVALIVGTFAAVVLVFRGAIDHGVLLYLIAFALCWMAFVLLGDVVLVRLFGGE
jgi:hypothetical protein